MAVAIILDVFLVGPTPALVGLRPEILTSRIPWLLDLTGLPGRWSGPFPNVHVAGMCGAWLVVFSIFTRRSEQIVLLPLGVWALLASESRSAFLATIVGWIVAAAFTKNLWLSITSLTAVPIVGLLVMYSPDGNGRSEIWVFHVREAMTNLLLGSGDPRIGHAHSTFIDVFSRYGVVAGLSLLAATTWTYVRLVKSSKPDRSKLLALFSVIVAGACFDTLLYLDQFGLFTLPLIFIIVCASVDDGEGIREKGKTNALRDA